MCRLIAVDSVDFICSFGALFADFILLLATPTLLLAILALLLASPHFYLRLPHFYLRFSPSLTFLLLNATPQFAFLLLVKMAVFELLLFPLLFGEAHLFFQDYPLTPCISCVVLPRIDS